MKSSNAPPMGPGITRTAGDAVEVLVSVQPRSSHCGVVGIQSGRLKIKLTNPPVDGRANAECCRFMAGLLGVARSRVRVSRGLTSRHKVVCIAGMTEAEVAQKLLLT